MLQSGVFAKVRQVDLEDDTEVLCYISPHCLWEAGEHWIEKSDLLLMPATQDSVEKNVDGQQSSPQEQERPLENAAGKQTSPGLIDTSLLSKRQRKKLRNASRRPILVTK